MMTTDNAALPRLAFITLPGPGRACCVVLDGCLVLAAEADDQPSLKSAVKRVARNLEAVVKTPAREVQIEDEDECDLDWDDLIQLLIDTRRIAGPDALDAHEHVTQPSSVIEAGLRSLTQEALVSLLEEAFGGGFSYALGGSDDIEPQLAAGYCAAEGNAVERVLAKAASLAPGVICP